MAEFKINLSLKDLEALIGSDHEAHVAVRYSIVNQFVDRYLKGIVNDQIVKDVEKRLLLYVAQSINDQVGKLTGNSWKPNVELKPEFKKKVDDYIKASLTDYIAQAVNEKYELLSERYISELDVRINQRIDREVAERVQKGIAAKLAEFKSSI